MTEFSAIYEQKVEPCVSQNDSDNSSQKTCEVVVSAVLDNTYYHYHYNLTEDEKTSTLHVLRKHAIESITLHLTQAYERRCYVQLIKMMQF